MAETLEMLTLRTAQQGQILEQYRADIFNLQLRQNLVVKILEEKGTLAQGEFEQRWPLYLKNDVGVVGSDGIMEGSLRVSWYGESK